MEVFLINSYSLNHREDHQLLVQNKLHFKIIGVLFSLPLSNLMKGGQEILGLNLCVNFTARFGACCVPSSQLI